MLARDLLARFPWLYRAEMRRRVLWSRVTRRQLIGHYLRSESVPRLHIGAGETVLDGWLNTDVRIHRLGQVTFLDARAPFPIPSGSLAYVFSEHQFEHISEAEAARMLAECFRVLRPGGTIRLATPDSAWVESLRRPVLNAEQQRYVAWMSAAIGRPAPDVAAVTAALLHGCGSEPGSGHQQLYSFESLQSLLTRAGFGSVRRCVLGESSHAALRGVERHGAIVGNEEMVRLETLVVEADRPLGDG
jgi:predicted SAM-dependent methyltransferase